ncbi:MAG: bacteriophage abortive infection AbiH family protein [Bacilli bacterium]|nr:bacteriophage abortive infection AbiH family protein [Bacilli bacterium]
MKKLFIIGNGFDIAHGLLTRFSNFREFLFNECNGEISYMPMTYIGIDGETVADRKGTAGLLIDLIDNTSKGDNWEDLEESMGRFEYLSYFDEYDMGSAIQDEDDDEMFRVAYAREDVASDLSCCIVEIKNLFSEWIDTIDIRTVKEQSRFISLFDEDTEFLTFNYTMTLEEIYDICKSKVCHIHGKQGSDIIVGHGNDDNPYIEETFRTFAIQGSLENLFDSLKKDVYGCFCQHSDFFQRIKLSQVEEIYSFGCAFSEPDRFYIMQLCKLIDTSKVIWHLAEFDEDKNETYESLIRNCGFKGEFGTLIPNK